MSLSTSVISVSTLVVSLFASTGAYAHGVTNAKAVELSLHRLERLIIMNKIDGSFQKNLQEATLEVLSHQTEEDPSFKTTFAQYSAADGTQQKVEVVLDEEGRPLSYKVTAGGDAANAPVWSQKDALSLAENGFHYVLEHGAHVDEIKLFDTKMVKFSLAQGTSPSGAAVAIVSLETDQKDTVLNVRVRLDGSLDLINGWAHEVKPRP